MPADLERRVRTADGVEIAFYDLGGSGPPVLLAHATGFHGRVFSPMAVATGGALHGYAIDERGHGASGRPPGGDYSWEGFAADVLAAVDALRDGETVEPDEPIFAMGHSAGGAALLLAEQARPGTFAALYCYEPVMFPSENPIGADRGNVLSEGARRRREEFASREEAFENFSTKGPFATLDPVVLRAYVDHGFVDVCDGSGRVRLACARDDEAEIYANGTAHDAYAHLGEVGCPVTLACGEKTDAFGPWVIDAFAQRLPDAQTVVLDGLGHFGPLQDPAAVGASIVESFSAVAARRA